MSESQSYTIRPLTPADRSEWSRMRTALWPDAEESEIEKMLGNPTKATVIVVAERPNGSLCGFAEAGFRNYAEGCLTSPVGFLEGIWVDADYRRTGVGHGLVRATEKWAAEEGCREFASDCLIENTASLDFHLATGFEEVERIICFRKELRG